MLTYELLYLCAPPNSCMASSVPALATISVTRSRLTPLVAIAASRRERRSKLRAGTMRPESVEYSPGRMKTKNPYFNC
jgi:hypothetical protein